MTRLLLIAAAVVLALAGASWLGFRAGQASGARTQAKVATQATADLRTSVNSQAAKQQAQMQVEQGKSLALATDQHAARSAADALDQEIDHAVFPVTVAAPDCPVAADPRATDDFVRLYDSAARAGGPDPAAAGTAR